MERQQLQTCLEARVQLLNTVEAARPFACEVCGTFGTLLAARVTTDWPIMYIRVWIGTSSAGVASRGMNARTLNMVKSVSTLCAGLDTFTREPKTLCMMDWLWFMGGEPVSIRCAILMGFAHSPRSSARRALDTYSRLSSMLRAAAAAAWLSPKGCGQTLPPPPQPSLPA